MKLCSIIIVAHFGKIVNKLFWNTHSNWGLSVGLDSFIGSLREGAPAERVREPRKEVNFEDIISEFLEI